MPLFRVNVRQIEVSRVISQVEVEAEDEEHAAYYAYRGIWKREFWNDKEYVQTTVRRLDPDTYTVMRAEPLQEMDKAQAARRLVERATNFETWTGESQEIELPVVTNIKTD